MATSVLHFAVDDPARAACGAPVFLCSDYTDLRESVDCKRCRKTTEFMVRPRQTVVFWCAQCQDEFTNTGRQSSYCPTCETVCRPLGPQR